MYVPEHFREARIEVLAAFMARHPLATLVAATAQGLRADHLPLLTRLSDAASGTLRGHIARGNSLWRELEADAPVLAVFTGADSYVSPNWYAAKREHGKVVPTWNYATVHVRGRIRFIQDPTWLRELVGELTDTFEAASPQPWRVNDAPEDYVAGMLRAIVGLEITVTEVVGKFKGSQNRSLEDRAGVEAALRGAGRGEAELGELVPR